MDSLEISCDFAQVGLAMESERRERTQSRRGLPSPSDLEYRLDLKKRSGRLQTEWTWKGGQGSEPVMITPAPPRRGYAAGLETGDWLVMVAPWKSVLPTLMVQMRSTYLLRRGASCCFEEVKTWCEENLAPLVNGVPAEEDEIWKISRLDLAADVAGVEIGPSDLGSLVTRASNRREQYLAESATAAHTGRCFTGFTLGTRGQPIYARIYDKTRESSDDASIRRVWSQAGYSPDSHGGQVWRIEFEMRRKLLRELVRADGSRLSNNPAEVLAYDLDLLWSYATGRWLNFRQATGSSRVERAKVRAWWTAVSQLTGLSSGIRMPPAERHPIREENPEVFFDLALSALAKAGALNGEPSLDSALQALRQYATAHGGSEQHCHRVAKAERRLGLQDIATPSSVDQRARALIAHLAKANRSSRGPAASAGVQGLGRL